MYGEFIWDKGQSCIQTKETKLNTYNKNTLCSGDLCSNMIIFIRKDNYGQSMPWRYIDCPFLLQICTVYIFLKNNICIFLHILLNPYFVIVFRLYHDSVLSMCSYIELIKGFYLREM